MKLLFILSLSQAGFFGTSKSDICSPIKEMGIKSVCYEKMKLKYHDDYLEKCEKVTGTTKKTPPHDWQNVINCLDLISGLSKNTIPEKQLDFCDEFYSKSRNSTQYLFCLQSMDAKLLEVCREPLKAGSYGFTYECLGAIQGYNSTQLNAQTLITECKKPRAEQVMRKFSWSTYAPCIQEYAKEFEDSRTPSRVDPGTGALVNSQK